MKRTAAGSQAAGRCQSLPRIRELGRARERLAAARAVVEHDDQRRISSRTAADTGKQIDVLCRGECGRESEEGEQQAYRLARDGIRRT